MASDLPFQMLFETFGRLPSSHAEPVNRRAYEQLRNVLSVPVENAGRCILLKAPRAGHGKTHLLSRLQHEFGISHEFVPLQAASGYRIDAASVIDDTLRRLVRALPASGGLSVLDLLARRLFSQALQPLVRSGEVPCQDREGALAALQNKPVETFDFHHPNAVTAHWAHENFEVLGPRLSLELSQRNDLPLREVSFWVNALFRFAATSLEDPTRARVLSETVFSHTPAEGDGDSMERLAALLGLLTSLVRVVLVADDLEGFSADETAALRLAAFLGSLRQSVERLDVILSLNQDIWDSAFKPRLSGGLADRLSEVVVPLEPLTEEEMVALIDSRTPGKGREILGKIDLGEAGTHSRGIIRAAAAVWADSAETVSRPPAEEVSDSPAAPVTVETAPNDEGPPRETEPVVAPAVASVFSPATHGLVSKVETVEEPFSQIAQENPFLRSEPEEPAFNPFSKPQDIPAVDVEASEVKPQSTWPSPTFAPPSADHPFAAIAKPEAAPAPGFAQPEPTSVPAPNFPSPFQMEPSAGEEPAFQPFQAAPAESAFQPPAQPVATAPQPVANPFLTQSTAQAAPASGFVPASIVGEPSVASAPAAEPVSKDSDVENQGFTIQSDAPSPCASSSAAETDRVDELLRQFRERYGRGSL
ncbi:MAG: hypothetical protein QM627_05875 [Luteolibacter sp.]